MNTEMGGRETGKIPIKASSITNTFPSGDIKSLYYTHHKGLRKVEKINNLLNFLSKNIKYEHIKM